MLPEEMWEEVLRHLELSDLARLKRVSKSWNEIITRVIKNECKWYYKCVAEIPEDMWSSLLDHQTHPAIRCENFHRAKMHSEIWITMYRSWIEWNRLMEKGTSVENIQIFSDEMIRSTAIFCGVIGNIVAAGICTGEISFYDITTSTVDPIWQVDHGAAISKVVLCKSGTDIMAVSASDDLRYWDLQTKKQIHRRAFGCSGRILYANFDYFYSLGCIDEHQGTWQLNVEQFVNGTVRLVRTATFTEAQYWLKALRPDCDRVLLYMDSEESCDKFLVNSPDNKFEEIPVQGKVLRDMHMGIGAFFRIFKPCVATYVHCHSRSFRISVNAKPWKMYDLEYDLGINACTSAILYHVGLLIVALEFDPFIGAEAVIYSIKNINDLDNLDFKAMKPKRLKFTSPCIDELYATEYDSCPYLLAVGSKKIHVVKFEGAEQQIAEQQEYPLDRVDVSNDGSWCSMM